MASGQEVNNIPRGIGVYQYGYRSFQSQFQRFGTTGVLEPLGKDFNKEFSGAGLLRGDGGAELQRLAEELSRYDGNAEGQDSLVNQLNLGKMTGDVNAEISAQIFGLAFGLTDNLSIFMGAPMIRASVNTQVRFAPGLNGAQAIKDRLGDLAFEELQEGLDRAAALDAGTIIDSIVANGYAPIDRWEHAGMGDFRLGTIWGARSPIGSSTESFFTLRSTVTVPTGYVEDPDILTDVSFGTGYYSVINEVAQNFIYRKTFWAGISGLYGYNLAATRIMRVPEGNEGIMPYNRRADVRIDPGADMAFQASSGVNLSALRFAYSLGVKMHQEDSYSGSLIGNYEAMGADSEMQQTYQIVSAQINTADLFRQKKFIFPFILEGRYYMPVNAFNSQDERFFELTFVSFFSTPMAMPDVSKETLKKGKKSKKPNHLRSRRRATAH